MFCPTVFVDHKIAVVKYLNMKKKMHVNQFIFRQHAVGDLCAPLSLSSFLVSAKERCSSITYLVEIGIKNNEYCTIRLP